MNFTKDSVKIHDHFSKRVNNRSFKEISELYKYLENVELLPYKLLKDENSSNFFNKIEENRFASQNIVEASSRLINNRSLLLVIGNIQFEININSKEKISNENVNIIVSYIRFICSLSKTYKKKIILNYYLTDEKKILERNNLLGTKEVNSGSCYSYETESKIEIWRKEELLKVTIHELIHGLCYDEYKDTYDLIEHYKNKYNIISDEINSREAYTEIWANIINCFLISQALPKNKLNCFKKMINIEKEFSLFQANKVIHMIEKYPDINKETNVLSYFIIRAELYNNLKNFLRFCKYQNKDYIKVNGRKFISFLKNQNEIISKKERENKLLKNYRMSANEYSIFTGGQKHHPC